MKTRIFIAVLFAIAVVSATAYKIRNDETDDLVVDRVEPEEGFESSQQYYYSFNVSSGEPTFHYSDGSSSTFFYIEVVPTETIMPKDTIQIKVEVKKKTRAKDTE